MKDKYSDVDEQSVAWLVAVYQLVPQARKFVSELYKCMQESSAPLPAETIQILEEEIVKHGRKPKRKKKKLPESKWKIGEIYCFDMASAYTDIPEFENYTFGFLCIDLYKYAGVHPVVYVFRTKSSMEEIQANPGRVLTTEFWRTCKWDNNRFEYRAILWTDQADKVPINRFHACGHISVFPEISDEFIAGEICYYPTIHFETIECDLLRTKALMQIKVNNRFS